MGLKAHRGRFNIPRYQGSKLFIRHCLTKGNLGPLHAQDCGPVTIALKALSLVEKAKPVQVQFTLRSRDPHSKVKKKQ